MTVILQRVFLSRIEVLFTQSLVVNYEIKSRMYQAAHVFFTEKCSDDLIEKIAKSKCSSFILTMKEIYMSFIPIENQVLLFLSSK